MLTSDITEMVTPSFMTAVQTVLTNTNQVATKKLTTVNSTGLQITTNNHLTTELQEKTSPISDERMDTAGQQDGAKEKKKPYGGRPLRFKCDHCERRFHAPSHLKRHMLCHSSERPYECRICKKGFLQAWHLSRHMTTHTGNKPFSCPECTKTFGSRFEMKTHCNYIHRGIKEHTCDVCNKTFTLRSNLKVHMRKHTGEKPYHCNICSKRFGQRGHLQYHMRKHEAEQDKDRRGSTDTICSNEESIVDKDSYDSGVDLESVSSGRQSTKNEEVQSDDEYTMMEITKSRMAESKKSIIGIKRVAPLSSRMFDHINPHELKPFVCESCNCGFGEISSLISHVRHSHPKRGIRNAVYSCAYCEKAFYEIDSLEYHFKTKHSEKHLEEFQVVDKSYSPIGRTCSVSPSMEKGDGLTSALELKKVSTSPLAESKCTCNEVEDEYYMQEKYLIYLHHFQEMLQSQYEVMRLVKQV